MVLLFPLLAALAQPPSPPPAPGVAADAMCGARCLHVALLAMTEKSPSLAALQQELGPPGASGFDFLRLSQVAERHGLHTLAVSTNLENLRARPERFACIAQIRNRSHAHFVLLYDVDDTHVEAIDPPRKLRIPIPTFRQLWTGQALLIGREGFIPEEDVVRPMSRWPLIALVVGLVLLLALALTLASRRVRYALGWSNRTSLPVFLLIASLAAVAGCRPEPKGVDVPLSGALWSSPPIVELGEQVLAGSTGPIRAVATITNASTSPIHIREIGVTCGCTTATLQQDTIPAGGSTTLTAWVDPGSTEGQRSARVTLQGEEAAARYRGRAAMELRGRPAHRGGAVDGSRDAAQSNTRSHRACLVEAAGAMRRRPRRGRERFAIRFGGL